MDNRARGFDHGAMEINRLIAIGGVFLAAGVVKGVSGMGLPTFAMAMLGLFMPPAAAAALMVLPSLATNLAQCLGPHWRMLVRRLWPLWLGLALATVLSPLPGLGTPGHSARTALGAVLAGYGLWGLARPALPDLGRHARAAGGAAGLLTGALTAATGVFVMPMVPLLQSLRLTKEAFIQALGLSFTVATLALAVRLGGAGGAELPSGLAGLLLPLGAALLGLRIGAALRSRLPPLLFQRALHGVFLLLGLVMLARSLQAGP
ncbi:MAG TPA: sulfite exporter TauE/SafE family protein [Ideonella sp.]|nr:sulfite exporter TauE/SafE family protein [Ideonella sp.]